jgi:DNA-binding IclR family transcriptional regulator
MRNVLSSATGLPANEMRRLLHSLRTLQYIA